MRRLNILLIIFLDEILLIARSVKETLMARGGKTRIYLPHTVFIPFLEYRPLQQRPKCLSNVVVAASSIRILSIFPSGTSSVESLNRSGDIHFNNTCMANSVVVSKVALVNHSQSPTSVRGSSFKFIRGKTFFVAKPKFAVNDLNGLRERLQTVGK